MDVFSCNVFDIGGRCASRLSFGMAAASPHRAQFVRIYSAVTGAMVRELQVVAEVDSMCLFDGGRRIAVATESKLSLYDVTSGSQLWSAYVRRTMDMHVYNDAHIVTLTRWGVVEVYDVHTGVLLQHAQVASCTARMYAFGNHKVGHTLTTHPLSLSLLSCNSSCSHFG